MLWISLSNVLATECKILFWCDLLIAHSCGDVSIYVSRIEFSTSWNVIDVLVFILMCTSVLHCCFLTYALVIWRFVALKFIIKKEIFCHLENHHLITIIFCGSRKFHCQYIWLSKCTIEYILSDIWLSGCKWG